MWSMAVKALSFLLLSAQLFAINEPVAPVISEPKDPEAVFSTNSNATSTLLLSVYLKKASGILVPATLSVTDRVIIVSNNEKTGLEVNSVNLATLKKIKCLSWKAKEIKPNLFKFTPSSYLLIGNKKYKYNGHLAFLDILALKNPPSRAYTIYFDRWVKGKNKVWRWKNNKATHFSYAFQHPLPNVVVEIRFNNIEDEHENK